ncbi:SurA N-terminal domain-containing protein [Virgibacillus necropolis]|uniref:peptidylprolyl isomerase n=1 Tax=Virgibacillus necropolis TaxID=163877 RepID=A0A221MD76_9BACI|nr:SurA N-terminal domain-containing protein [Virgibacillus necropolis]ASN05626.1 peptidylprolyl isomerase [Virgibacillus necropolis]
MTLSKKWILSLLLVVFVSLLAACGNQDETAGDKDNNNKSESQEEGAQDKSGKGGQAEMPKPDLKGIPDVVAEVNGEKIPKDEFETVYKGQFQQAAMQSQMTGKKVDQDKLKKQIAEGLVGQKLLIQEVNKRDYQASKEEIDKTLKDLAKQNQIKSTDEFLATLKKQGMDEKEVMSQVETQVKVDKLIASESGDIEPTKEELEKAYEQVKAQQKKMGGEGKVPSFDEVKPALKEQIKGQKKAKVSQKLVKNLRKDADVTVNL